MVEGLGLTPALLLTGGLYLMVTVVPFVQPTWREMDRPRRRSAARLEPVAS
ncbi:MAG TPA: hypothetical protein VGJ86_19685 [Acidimicrobiales bacterium]|jgi:hypothetical protein